MNVNEDNESTNVNTPDTTAVQNMQNAQSLPSSSVIKNRKGQHVRSRDKLQIINLYKAKIQQPYMNYKDLMSSITKETGFGYNTVCNTVKDYKKNNKPKSSNRKKNRQTINDRINMFDKCAIRRKIHSLWFKDEIPTLKKLVKALIDDSDLPIIPKTSLQRVFKKLGFERTKLMKKMALTERCEIVVHRKQYIEDIRRYRREGRTVYYLGETWVDTSDGNKTWMDNKMKLHGDALIVVHIGSAEGFVEGGILCFESRKNYYDKMNDIFHDWFCEILPKLNANSVIVMDDAPYHSVEVDPIPTDDWSIDKIIQWLTSKNCVIETPILKPEAMAKVREIRHLHQKYVIDEVALTFNKIVLRLPPCHWELNPIELAWVAVKDHIRCNQTTFDSNSKQQLLIEAVSLVTPGMWANFIDQTIVEEDKLLNVDQIIGDMLEKEFHLMRITGDISSDCSN